MVLKPDELMALVFLGRHYFWGKSKGLGLIDEYDLTGEETPEGRCLLSCRCVAWTFSRAVCHDILHFSVRVLAT